MNFSFKELHFESLDSTNAYLKREYQNLDNLTIVSTSFQTNGRGRLDRKWISEPNTNLLFSLLIKEGNLIKAFPYLSLVTALGVAKALIKLGLSNVSIKWPNDVYVNGRKIAGILLEGSLPEYLIIGVGLNVNQVNFEEGLRHLPTSLQYELSKYMKISKVKNLVFFKVEDVISDVLNGKTKEFIEEINSLSYLNNKQVEASINGVDAKVKVIKILDDCSLLVDTGNEKISLSTGEIILK